MLNDEERHRIATHSLCRQVEHQLRAKIVALGKAGDAMSKFLLKGNSSERALTRWKQTKSGGHRDEKK